MDFQNLITQRQSVRKYTDQIIEKEKLTQCLEAARLAPSASNSQPWKFTMVTENQKVKEVAAACFSDGKVINKFALQVPAFVVITLEKARLITRLAMMIKKKEWPLIDIGITATHFCLQAAELGLGTCMIGWFNDAKLRKALDIPKDKTIALVISVGYAPDDYPLRKKIRKSVDEVVSWEKYND